MNSTVENSQQKQGAIRRSIRRHLILGTAVILLLNVGIGGWAAATSIAGALIAQGTIVVDSHVKTVQHPTGGVIGEILVHDGSRVKAGDLLVRLDDTVTRSTYDMVSKGLDEFLASKARLSSERDGEARVIFPEALTSRASAPEIQALMQAEQRLFELRLDARDGQKRQLKERIGQMQQQVQGLTAQRDAKTREIALMKKDFERLQRLLDQHLIDMTRVNSAELDMTHAEGEEAELEASISEARGKIAEIELQIIQVDRDLASEVAKEMRETDAKIGEFVERKVAAEDQLRRVEIRAPQDGDVHELAVHTIGGVVPAGETLMSIVPSDDKLAVEARVNPQDIDQLHLGQGAALRFSAFSQRTTPEIDGTVTDISADISTDQRTGATYYSIRIGLKQNDIARLGNVSLVPGMPVESFVQTGERSVASYLVKPFYDQAMRAFREN